MEDKDLFSIVDLANCLQQMKEKYSRDASDVRSALGTTTGVAVNTPLSLIGNPRWSDVVEDETVGRRSEGVKDSLPLTKARGISNLSHEG